ncbi:N-acetylmuramoyl-L-alanine amidase [Sorangium sp. So ce1335]|uniref:N-acetylmuramoyl-L-alanine amidase n=1 Tax=Sorangium sp. So ce1335 TaxID=3133335 RepID=UPI003F612477
MKPPGRIAVLSSRRADRADPASRRHTTPAQPHRNALAFARITLFAAIAHALGCGADGDAPAAPPAPSDEQRAAALLDPGARLPPRAETVALADTIAIASSRAGAPAQAASLAELAGDLRVRLFRLDQAATDAREAMELYTAAAIAFRASTDPAHVERACQAERRRALLAGELARDAAVAYRELYLVSRRYAALAPPAPSAGAPSAGAPPSRSTCLGAIAVALAQAAAYRPSGEALRALEHEGHRVEGIALALAPGHAPVPSAAPASAASPASAAPVQVTAADAGGGDLVVAPRATASSGPVKITAIERHGSDKGARVVVALSGPTTFDVGTLPADESAGKDARVFVDIAGATSRGIAREIEVGGVLRRVRVGVQPKGTRVVLDLAPDLYRRVFYLPEPFRIVIDVSTRPPVRDDERKPGGAREVRRVAIDPGHGGNDTGAVGPTGLKEKDVTLDVAHRVAPLLARELKIETLLTRDSDVYVPLELRTARANAFHADLFVSIHCNASENGRARGVQTFSLAPSRDVEAPSAKLAARENAPRAARAGQGAGPDDPESRLEVEAILSNLNVGDMAARSRHFAELLQRASLASLAPRYPDTKDQGVKGAGFFVLAGADMPAALFETAFISNPEDEARLATADFRQKMADAIVNAIRAYREGK